MLWPEKSADRARRRALAACPSAKEVESAQLPGGAGELLSRYFAGEEVDFGDVPVDLSGHPPFRRSVLTALRRVAYGRTTSYGELARRVKRPAASRAVGQAVGANPIPVIIPCHRVLRSDGGLGGFSADEGLPLKRRLLEMEGA